MYVYVCVYTCVYVCVHACVHNTCVDLCACGWSITYALVMASTSPQSIYSANINGNMTMATPLITCLSEPTDLAVDWAGLNLFWTDAQRRVIEVAKATTGSSRTVLAMLPRRPDRLALDPRRGCVCVSGAVWVWLRSLCP